MFVPEGPTVRELAVQALSSVERGYDLLAPKFDLTPFRTPDAVLDAVARALRPLGPFGRGMDLCCGTGAGMDVLAQVCRESITGVDLSAGMLVQGRATWPRARRGTPPQPWPAPAAGPAPSAGPVQSAQPLAVTRPLRAAVPPKARVDWVRGDAMALPFGAVFDLVVSFGAFGHFLPSMRPELFAQVKKVLRPGGRFVFPVVAPARPGSPGYWMLLAFDVAMRVRNALWRPPFVMYYRTFPPAQVCRDLAQAGFEVRLRALPELGFRPDGSPRCGLVVATLPGGR
ncbi:class I SAM-dependent methyltransferase [Streptomyces sp. TS71-3]|uniref:class I SAM-dependent methyltransferase n=1 Tax=Streptomyces sp. TS71-3 TaxID=2733862 RepID=UPI001B15212B|nr:class I SAM-dependent methyltransferase [Streptomyces sp. TS71-3]GHJ42326.1 methyltransferase [Streptomyces sp. TS71-3]